MGFWNEEKMTPAKTIGQKIRPGRSRICMACKRFVGSIPIASTEESWSERISGQDFLLQISTTCWPYERRVERPFPRRQRLATFNEVLDDWIDGGCKPLRHQSSVISHHVAINAPF
jgi:hypothetical protein